MGLSLYVKGCFICPFCKKKYEFDFVDIFFDHKKVGWKDVETPYGNDYVFRCKRCRKQILRVRLSY